MTKRALAYIRLSKLTETTTSPERQRADVTRYIEARGWELVGYVEDIDVSATRRRLDRPGIHELRRRFANGEADVAVVSRLDRIARNVADVSLLLDEGIAIVSASESFDMSTPQGKAMGQVAQVFAELEASTIGLRVASSRKYLPTVGRWPGGPTPYGYSTEVMPEGAGRTLVIDADEGATVRRMVDEVLAGKSVLDVTRRLNADGIRPRRGGEWSRTVVARILRHGSIRGYATVGGSKSPRKGEAQVRGDKVRDERGVAVVVWPPIVTPEEGHRLDRILTVGASAPKTLHDDKLLLIGLAVCSSCGRLMTARAVRRPSADNPDRRLALYTCQTRGGGGQCDLPQTVSAHLADEAAERQFLIAFGRVEVTETVQEAIEPVGLRDLVRAINETTDAMRGPGADLGNLAARLLTLVAERDKLAAPSTRAIVRLTGETYRDLWRRSTIEKRRRLMLGAQAFALVHPATRRGLFTPERIAVNDALAGALE